jgi:hypothetical protein
VLYRYHKEMLETYDDGRLVSYETEIDDNGTKSAVRVTRDGGKLSVTHPKGTLSLPGNLLLSTYWPPATVRQTELVDSSEGVLLGVKVSAPVAEDLEIDDRTVKTKRYEMTGDLKRTLWYDAKSGKWLKMRMTARDDSIVEIERDWPPVWKPGLL